MNKVATALAVFERILKDAPDIDIGWARDTSLKLAKITVYDVPSAFESFISAAIPVVVQHLKQRNNISQTS